jgi:hypothetical protein
VNVKGSLTMEKCTATGTIVVGDERFIIDERHRASLVMEDCRVFGSVGRGGFVGGGGGVSCLDTLKATRCTFEDNAEYGVGVHGQMPGSETKLVDCVVRNNGGHGVWVWGDGGETKLILDGGTISGNKKCGVFAHYDRDKVTVAPAEHIDEPPIGRPQTVCSGNVGQDWALSDWSGHSATGAARSAAFFITS